MQIEWTGIKEDLTHIPKGLIIQSWHKQNNIISSTFPLERMFFIRNSIKQFLSKWGKKNNDEGKIALTEVSHPDEFSNQWTLVTAIQLANRAASVIGGSLVLVGTNQNKDNYIETGGIIAVASPFIETLTSYVSDNIYLYKKNKWDEFINDAGVFLKSFNELLTILKQFDLEKKAL